MVAHGYDDVEGDLLSKVRAIVGPDVPIGAELDPHSHLTDLRFDSADILIAFKEFPHIDVIERAEEVVDYTLKMIRKEMYATPALRCAVFCPALLCALLCPVTPACLPVCACCGHFQQACDGQVRLPYDRSPAHLNPADARIRRSYDGNGGPLRAVRALRD